MGQLQNGAAAEHKANVKTARVAIDVALGEEERRCEARLFGGGAKHTGDGTFMYRTSELLRQLKTRR